MRTIRILDTTLRDGEQAPGCSMNLHEKLEVARALEALGVDVIEAGFPGSSPGDLKAVEAIAALVKKCQVAALCRARAEDIDAARIALARAECPRMHLFLAASPIHLEHKLKISPEEMLDQAAAAVRYARCFCPEVQFSAEDATRSDRDFLCRVFEAVIEAGACVVGLADTVGYAMPEEFAALVRYVRDHVAALKPGASGKNGGAALSVHCHNDLGLAVANSILGAQAGADQVECTVNGIGERAGNASLEEVVMALRLRQEFLGLDTGIDTTQIYTASRLVSQATGVKVQPNKAVVGENAFAHESGIHQHGVMMNPATYEIMRASSLGIPQKGMVLGRHSGRHAFEERLSALGLSLQGDLLEKSFEAFKILSGKKKNVSDRDLEALVMGVASSRVPETWTLEYWSVSSGSETEATYTVRLRHASGALFERTALGDGPIDAAFKAINSIISRVPALEIYELDAITGGMDAQGRSAVKISFEGRFWNGRGISTDIVESSIKAYLNAINAMEWELG